MSNNVNDESTRPNFDAKVSSVFATSSAEPGHLDRHARFVPFNIL